jgi:hypothetical protein
MIQRDKIKDWTGKIIGIIETDTVSGNKVVKDWHGRILGKYIKKFNHTQDFYGRIVAKGDQSSMLLANRK